MLFVAKEVVVEVVEVVEAVEAVEAEVPIAGPMEVEEEVEEVEAVEEEEAALEAVAVSVVLHPFVVLLAQNWLVRSAMNLIRKERRSF